MSAPVAVEGILSSSSHLSNEAAPAGPADLGLVAPAQNAASLGTALPADLADSIWRGNQLGGGRSVVVATGFAELDAELPDGGWPCGCLVEVLQPQPSLAEWRLVGPALGGLVAGGRMVVLIGPPKRPHLPGLRHLAIDESRLVWIRAEAPSERLWATEQLVRANAAAAVLTWLPQARPEQLRRLQVLAQGCEGPVFVFRPVAARHDPSPAPLRLLVSPLIDWRLQVHILKRRGPAHEGPLLLSSVPGGLQHVLTARTLKPSLLLRSKEVPSHALGRSAHLDFAYPAAFATDSRLQDRAASPG